MRIFLLLTVIFAFVSMTSLNADELNQETSSKIIKQAETSYKKVLKVKMFSSVILQKIYI